MHWIYFDFWLLFSNILGFILDSVYASDNYFLCFGTQDGEKMDFEGIWIKQIDEELPRLWHRFSFNLNNSFVVGRLAKAGTFGSSIVLNSNDSGLVVIEVLENKEKGDELFLALPEIPSVEETLPVNTLGEPDMVMKSEGDEKAPEEEIDQNLVSTTEETKSDAVTDADIAELNKDEPDTPLMTEASGARAGKKQSKARVIDFKVFGEKMNQVAAITNKRHVLIYEFGFPKPLNALAESPQKQIVGEEGQEEYTFEDVPEKEEAEFTPKIAKMVQMVKIEKYQNRKERPRLISVCPKNKYICVYLKNSRLVVLEYDNSEREMGPEGLKIKTFVDIDELFVDPSLMFTALEFYGYFRNHIILSVISCLDYPEDYEDGAGEEEEEDASDDEQIIDPQAGDGIEEGEEEEDHNEDDKYDSVLLTFDYDFSENIMLQVGTLRGRAGGRMQSQLLKIQNNLYGGGEEGEVIEISYSL